MALNTKEAKLSTKHKYEYDLHQAEVQYENKKKDLSRTFDSTINRINRIETFLNKSPTQGTNYAEFVAAMKAKKRIIIITNEMDVYCLNDPNVIYFTPMSYSQGMKWSKYTDTEMKWFECTAAPCQAVYTFGYSGSDFFVKFWYKEKLANWYITEDKDIFSDGERCSMMKVEYLDDANHHIL